MIASLLSGFACFLLLHESALSDFFLHYLFFFNLYFPFHKPCKSWGATANCSPPPPPPRLPAHFFAIQYIFSLQGREEQKNWWYVTKQNITVLLCPCSSRYKLFSKEISQITTWLWAGIRARLFIKIFCSIWDQHIDLMLLKVMRYMYVLGICRS